MHRCRHEPIGNAKPEPETLQSMRERGGTWAAYQAMALDSVVLGHMKFLQVGPTNTFQQAPTRMLDMPGKINWRYLFVGYVDLPTGEINDSTVSA